MQTDLLINLLLPVILTVVVILITIIVIVKNGGRRCNQRLNQEVLNRHQIPFLLLSPELEILGGNPSAERFFKQSACDLKGKHLDTLVMAVKAGVELRGLRGLRGKYLEPLDASSVFSIILPTLIDNKTLPCHWRFQKFPEKESRLNQILVSITADSRFLMGGTGGTSGTECAGVGVKEGREPEETGIKAPDTQLLAISLELAEQGSFVINWNKQEITFGDNWMARLGYHSLESTQSIDFILSLVAPTDRDRVTEAFKNEESFDLNYKIASFEGVEVYVRALGKRAPGRAGNKGLVRGIQVIVTQRVATGTCLQAGLGMGLEKDLQMEPQRELQKELQTEKEPLAIQSDTAYAGKGNAGVYVVPLISSIVKNSGISGVESRHAFDNLQMEIPKAHLSDMLSILLQNSVEASSGDAAIVIESGKSLFQQQHCAACHEAFTGIRKYVAVIDYGSGIKDEFLPSLFNPMFTTKRICRSEPTGLYRLQQLVHASQGHILMDFTGGYSCFKLCFPESIVHSGRSINGEEAHNGKEARFQLLVLDDHPTVARFLTSLLNEASVEVTAVSHPQTAFDLLKQDPDHFNLMITDQNLPGLRGDEVIEVVREIAPYLPVVLCSGGDNAPGDEFRQRKGFFGYLAKPINVSKLIKMIDSVRLEKSVKSLGQ